MACQKGEDIGAQRVAVRGEREVRERLDRSKKDTLLHPLQN